MSEPLRIALVGEGPTEKVVIEAVLTSVLSPRSFVLRQLQPEESAAFGPVGTGWTGVYRWCREAVSRANGPLRQDILYQAYDLLVLQVDADVAACRYEDGNIQETATDLPCEEPCPPPSATTNRLRAAVLRWAGEMETPPKTILCTPSKSLEAWVVAALFPNDLAVQRGIECWADPASRLGQQPLAQRVRKRLEDYRGRSGEMAEAWPRLAQTLDEARRFEAEVRSLLPPETAVAPS